MASRSGSRRHRIRRASLVVLGAFACDLGVEPPPDTPLLAVSAREVDLFVARGSEDPDEVTIQISNNGRGTLSGLRIEDPVYVGAASDWLERTLQGTTLTLSADGLTSAGDTLETGSYEAYVDVVADAAGNSPRTITVKLQVGKSQQIALSVDKVTFAAMATNPLPPRQTVTISNGGDGVLSELVIDDIVYGDGEVTGWLVLADTLVQARADTVVELWPNIVPDKAGTLHATIIVGSRIADPPKDTIQVEYIVAPPPTLVLSAKTLELEAVEGETTPLLGVIALREIDRRPLTGLTEPVSSNPEWLTAALDAPDAPATLTITVDPADLAGDTLYRDTVFVSSSAGVEEEVVVSLRVRRGPTVHLSMGTVRFTLNPTDVLPSSPQVVRIENSGAGILQVEDPPGRSPGSGWLSALLRDATDPNAACVMAPCNLVLEIVEPIASGTGDTDTVKITAGDSTANVTVKFEMLQGPSVVSSSHTLKFFNDTLEAKDTDYVDFVTLAVANENAGRFDGLRVDSIHYQNAGDNWLQVTPPPLAVVTDTLQLRLREPQSFLVIGTHRADVFVSWTNEPTRSIVAVEYELVDEKVQDDDSLLVSHASNDPIRLVSHSAGPTQPQTSLWVENKGSRQLGPLRVTISPSLQDNLRAEFFDPVGNDNRTPTTLKLEVVRNELFPAGPVTGDVTISVGTISSRIPVVIDMLGPQMVATADSVQFLAFDGQPVQPQAVTVYNGSTGSLTGVSVSNTPPWLDAEPTIPMDAPAAIQIQPESGLGEGSYQGSVRIRSDSSVISPIDVDVVLAVRAGPTLATSHNAVRLSAVEGDTIPDVLTVDLYNSGWGDLGGFEPLEWAQREWLTAAIDQSVVPARLVLEARAEMLSSDQTDVVRVTSKSGSAADVAVSFAVAPQPEIQVSPAALVFHADANTDVVPAEQAITVFDPAGGPSGQIAAAIEPDTISWLAVDVDSVTTTPVTVVVRPNQVLDSRMSPYEATVAIESTVGTGAAQRVRVTYNIDVGRDPVIELSDTRLEFRRPTSAQDVVPAQTVEITNSGSRTLRELSVEDVTEDGIEAGPVDWLFVLLDSRIAPATLTVAIKPAEAAATQRPTATLEITGEDAEPRRLTVVLREGS